MDGNPPNASAGAGSQPDPWAAWNASQRARTNHPGMSLPTTYASVGGTPLRDASVRNQPFFGNQLPVAPGFAPPNLSPLPQTAPLTYGPPSFPQTAGYDMNAASFATALGSSTATPLPQSFSAFDLLGKSNPMSRSSPSTPSQPKTPDQMIAQALNQALVGERKPVPTWTGTPSTLRSWLKMLSLWEFESQVPLEKRGIKLLQSFPEGSQPRRIADTVPVEILLSPSGYGAILSAIYQKYSAYLDAAAPQAIDKFLFEGERQKNESFSSFIAAKQLARQEMELQMGETVNDKLCGRILLRQAGLNDLQRDLVSLKGPALHTFDEVARMLRPLDRPEMLARAADSTHTSKNFVMNKNEESRPNSSDEMIPDDQASSGDESSLEDAEGYPYVYFEDTRMYEEPEAIEIMAYHSAYRDVRKELQKRRNDRGFYKRSPQNRRDNRVRKEGKGKGKGKSKSKLSFGKNRFVKGYEDDLVSRVRCFRCDEVGHISRDCPHRDQAASSTTPPSKPGKQFVVHSGVPSQRPQQFMMTSQQIHVFAGIRCSDHEALVDTAAEDAVIGSTAMRRLEAALRHVGLQPLPVSPGTPVPGAGGIGGSAVVERLLEVPVGVAKINSILRFTVLKDTEDSQIPPLLPVSFLDTIKAVVDLPNNMLHCVGDATAPMRKLSSRHRAVSILDFDDDGWCLPQELRRDPNIDPFVIQNPDSTLTDSTTVWLLVGDTLHFVKEFQGLRSPMVVPDECPQLPVDTLSPERVTYAYMQDGHHMVIRDKWQAAFANRNLSQPWSGSVVFASANAALADSYFGEEQVNVDTPQCTLHGGNMSSSILSHSSPSSIPSSIRSSSTSSPPISGKKHVDKTEPSNGKVKGEKKHQENVSNQENLKLSGTSDNKAAEVQWKEECHHESQKECFELSCEVDPKQLNEIKPNQLNQFAEKHVEFEIPCFGVAEERHSSSPEGASNFGGQKCQDSIGMEAFGSSPHVGDSDYPSRDGVRIPHSETEVRGRGSTNWPQHQASEPQAKVGAEGKAEHWNPIDSVQGSAKLESRSRSMSSRSRVSSAPSWAWTLLVHLSPMWRALGAHRTPIKLDDLGIHFHSHPSQGIGQFPEISSSSTQPSRVANTFGGSLWQGSAEVQADASSSFQTPRTCCRSDGWVEAGIPGQNTNTDRFTWHCRELRVDDRTPSFRTRDDDGGRVASCYDVRSQVGHRPRRSDGTTLGRRSELLSSQLVHSSQLSTWDEALARKVRSISRLAMMILLCTFACESGHMAPKDFDAINPELDCPIAFPLWMSRPSHCLLRTENYLETPANHTEVSHDTTMTTWKVAWLIPMTSSNQWLFQEDTSWNKEPKAIPKSVKAFITQAVRDHFGTDIMEIYSPPRVTKEAQRQNDQGKNPPFRVGQAMDLTTGFDFRRSQDRALALKRVRTCQPALLILCPPCTTFSPLRNLSNHKRDPQVVYEEESEGLLHWEFTLVLAKEQIENKRAFLLEHPAGASSWEHPTVKQLEQLPGVYQIVVDMCCFSLRTKEGIAAKKPTRLLTNCYPLVKLLRRRCQNHHPHQPLLGGRAKEAAKYTRPFVQTILRGLRHFLNIYGVTYTSWGQTPMPPSLPAPLMDVANETTKAISQVLATYIHGEANFLEEYHNYITYAFPSSKILGGEIGDDDDIEDPVMERARKEIRAIGDRPQVQQLSKNVKAMSKDLSDESGETALPPNLRREVYRLHRNLGHPDPAAFIRALRHAGAKPEVIQWVKYHFECPVCASKRKPNLPRPGHLVRSLQFNDIVGIDTLFFDWKDQTIPMINIVCWGSGLQIVEPINEKTAKEAKDAFLRAWCTPFGVPSVVIADQGTEFTGTDFMHIVSDLGIMVHLIDSRSPWQNAKTEKAGGLFKSKLQFLLDECSVVSMDEFLQCVRETCIGRNRYYHRSGFSPYQRAFGYNPRLPASIASDDQLSPELLIDSAHAEVQRSWQIRDIAAQSWLRHQDAEVVKRAVRGQVRNTDVKPLNVGDWVFVWRDTAKHRGWTGPGVVLAISPNERSLWISLRGQLLKTSREQTRPATSEEHLGAELIKELSSEILQDIQAGRVKHFHDITADGNPEEEHEVEITVTPLEELDQAEDTMEIDQPHVVPAEDDPHVLQPIPEDEQYTPSIAPIDEPVVEQPDMEVDTDHSTREPSSRPSSAVPSRPISRRVSIGVDEASGGILRYDTIEPEHVNDPPRESPSFGPVRQESQRSMPYPFSTPPRLPSSTTSNQQPTHFFEVAAFDQERSRQTFWTAGSDGAAWWKDKRTSRFGLSALGNETFSLEQAGASYSCADHCMYMTQMKLAPGHVDFEKLNRSHQQKFREARDKEIKSLLDNKAIHILSEAESRAFEKKYPERILTSKFVDRWKPTGGKFAVLPEEFEDPSFDPAVHEGLSAKSRWCVKGWMDPDIHQIERSDVQLLPH